MLKLGGIVVVVGVGKYIVVLIVLLSVIIVFVGYYMLFVVCNGFFSVVFWV